jgi:hypothetical protein
MPFRARVFDLSILRLSLRIERRETEKALPDKP